MAAIQFDVVIVPKRELKEIELSCRPLPLYSVTIQLSKTVHRRVRDIPAAVRPRKRIARLFDKTVRHEVECKTQKAKQAARRPNLSARTPTAKADRAAAT